MNKDTSLLMVEVAYRRMRVIMICNETGMSTLGKK